MADDLKGLREIADLTAWPADVLARLGSLDEAQLEQILDEAREALPQARERREREAKRELAAQIDEAVRALARDPSAHWTARHRRWYSLALKAHFARKWGAENYLRRFPW